MTDLSLRVFDSVLDMLSNEHNPTPIVRLNRVVPFKQSTVYAKLEWYNPFGAVKDRIAANLVRDARERGINLENLVEPTSGKTGMGLAMIANTGKLNSPPPSPSRASAPAARSPAPAAPVAPGRGDRRAAGRPGGGDRHHLRRGKALTGCLPAHQESRL
jgi:hypothetical protein